MQCARCAQALPDGSLFCPACGLPVATTGASSPAADANMQPPDVSSRDAGRMDAIPAMPDFAFQEFNSAPAALPPTPLPGVPGQGSMYPLPVPPGQVAYPPFVVPGAPIPAQPKRRGRSMGCIILYIVLAFLLVFVGLGVGAYAVGSHFAAARQANQAAAMKLYQDVTSQAPTGSDTLTNSAQSLWDTSNTGCNIEQDGLHVYINDAGHLTFCVDGRDTYANFAFQVQMSIVSGDGGLIFRLDDTGYDLYAFQINTSGDYSVFLDNGPSARAKVLTSGFIQSSSLRSGQSSTITVIVKNTTFDFYLNQQLVVQEQDTTFQDSGYFGMIASDQNAPAEAVYTNAKIWDLDV